MHITAILTHLVLNCTKTIFAIHTFKAMADTADRDELYL